MFVCVYIFTSLPNLYFILPKLLNQRYKFKKRIFDLKRSTCRVSKTHEDTNTCPPNIFYNLCKTLTLERNLAKQAFFIFLVQFDNVLSNLLCFIAILVHNSAQNYIRQNSVSAKQFTFRRSEYLK